MTFKNVFIFLFAIVIIWFSICGCNQPVVSQDVSDNIIGTNVNANNNVDFNEIKLNDTVGDVNSTTDVSNYTDAVSTVITENVTDQENSNTDESSDPAPKNTDTATVETSTSTETQTADSSTGSEHQETDTSISTDNTTDNTTSTNVSTEDTSDETPSVESQPASPYDVIAKEGTEELLAERMIYYINLYREEEGNITATVLPGLTELCEYRSRQLINNFAHDARDIREAATSLQYGRYTDPALWGIDDEQPYYDPMTQEAIGKYSVFSPYTVDAVAQKIASAFRKSDGHWAYLGASSQINKDCEYIGAGATFYNGTWFVCVCVTNTDIYG